MKNDLKNNRRLIHNFKCLSLRSTLNALCSMLSAYVSKLLVLSSMLFAFCLFFCWILFPNRASSGPYLDSAHGNTAYGVNRTSISSFNYSMGNCAHCHEQHASIGGQTQSLYGYELFYDHWIDKCDLFCYRCHSNIVDAEQQVTNYMYSYNFDGESASEYDNIKTQFCNDNSDFVNCGSKHHLVQIRGVIENNMNGWGFPADPDPCSACHNPHLVQRTGSKQYHSPFDPNKSLIVRPSEHQTNPLNLWGDDSPTERMNYYAQTNGGTYQAPYYGSFNSGLYEPSGNGSPSDGSDLPDYVSFCMDCHKDSQYDPERGAVVKDINWGPTGDRHGGYRANDCTVVTGFGEGSLRSPYNDLDNSNYILSCTDCHEPHAGRRRLHLIRRYINGEALSGDTGSCDESVDMRAVCERCHILPPSGHTGDEPCFASGCHGHGVKYSGLGGCQNKPNF